MATIRRLAAGDWFDTTKWDLGRVPTSTDDVLFINNIGTVDVFGTASVGTIRFTTGIWRFNFNSSTQFNVYGDEFYNEGNLTNIYNDPVTGNGTIIFRNAAATLRSSTFTSGANWKVNIAFTSGAGLTITDRLSLPPEAKLDLSNASITISDFVTAGFLKFNNTTINSSNSVYFYSSAQDRLIGATSTPDVEFNHSTTTFNVSGYSKYLYVTPPNPGVTKTVYGDDTGLYPENTANNELLLRVEGSASGEFGHIDFTGGWGQIWLSPDISLTYTIERLYVSLFSNSRSYADTGAPQMTLTTVSGQTLKNKTIQNYLRVPGFTFSNTSGSAVTVTHNSQSGGYVNGDVTFNSGATLTTLRISGGNLNLLGADGSGDFQSFATVSRTIDFNGYSIICNNFDTSASTNLSFIGTPNISIRTPSTGNTVNYNPGAITTYNVSISGFTGGTVNLTGAVNNLYIANQVQTITSTLAVTVYGNVTTVGPNPTITASFLFSGATTQLFDGGNATWGGDLTVSKAGGILQITYPFNMSSTATFYHNAGTLDFNGQTCTLGIFNSSNSNTRIIAIGDSSITVSGSGTAWNCGTSTNLTVTYGAAGRINMTSGLPKTFAGGGKIWPTVNQGGTGTLSVTGNNTFLNFTNTVTGCTIAFPSGTTTFTNFDVKGAFGSLVTMSSTSTLSKATGTVSVNYLNLSNSTATGGANWYAGTSSIDGGGNSGWQFIGSSSGGGFLAFF